MLSSIVLAFLLPLVLSLINLYSDHMAVRWLRRDHLVSLGSGFSIAYLFLALLPETLAEEPTLHRALFFSMLVGFVVFRLAEVLIYTHAQGPRRRAELKTEHGVVFFVYHLLIGTSLIYFLQQDARSGVLFFVPVALHVLATSAGLHSLHGTIRGSPLPRLVLSAAPLIGAFLALALPLPRALLGSSVGLVIGALFFVVIKELLPPSRKAEPQWFVSGIIVFIFLQAVLGVVV